MARTETDLPGYELFETESRTDIGLVELLVPIAVKESLLEERRQRFWEEAQRVREERARRESVTPAVTAAAMTPSPPIDPTAFTRAFNRGVARRRKSRQHPVLTAQEVLRVASTAGRVRDKDYAKRDTALIDKIKVKGALRAVANPAFAPSRWTRSLAQLRSSYPHFREVTDFVADQISCSSSSRGPLTIPPLHLWGPPGVGKTRYANDLAKALEAPIRHQSMENAQTTSLLLGTERHWSNAAPGIIFDAIVLGDFANPVFLIDEIDKAPRGGQYDPLAPLHSLLEPLTAKKVRDASLDIEFDASLAIYIATSNDPRRVPSTLLSRFRQFEIRAPRGEDALQVARAVVAAAIEQRAVPGFAVPAYSLAHKLAHLTAREIMHAVHDAVARAASAGRSYLVESDFPAEILGVDRRPLLH